MLRQVPTEGVPPGSSHHASPHRAITVTHYDATAAECGTESYEGGIENGLFHGEGCLVWKNGDKYDVSNRADGAFAPCAAHSAATLIM